VLVPVERPAQVTTCSVWRSVAERLDQLRALMEACQGRYRDVVPVLALASLRWGELAYSQGWNIALYQFAARADPKVTQRVLGHAIASMTMDHYGHLMDANLWEAARAIGGILGAPETPEQQDEGADDTGTDESADAGIIRRPGPRTGPRPRRRVLSSHYSA